jgi:DNA polymerase III subunit delta'
LAKVSLQQSKQMLFRDIIGHNETKQTLIRSVQQNHVAHAQLFDGPVGGAGLALALAFGTYINCEDKQPDDACGRCSSCAKMSKLAHPDFYHIFPVANTTKIKGNTSENFMALWRKFVIEHPYRTLSDWLNFIEADNKQGNISAEEARNIVKKLSLKAFEGEYKIMLLWLPEILNNTSANALLKILEEPPEKTLFLLVSNNSDRLLTTIISRTQRVSVRSFTDDETVQYLQNQDIDQKRSKQIAYFAEGDFSAALKMTTETDDNRHTWFAEWMRSAYKPDLVRLVKLADEFDAFTKDKQKGIFEYSLGLFRDLFLWQNGAESLLRLEDDELRFVQNFGKIVKPQALEILVHEINDGYYHIERNARAKVLFLDISLSAARVLRS